MPRIYMDHHATTPVDPRVLATMLPFFSESFGNASSRNHAFGNDAAEAVEHSRAQVAKLVGAAAASEIVFTSGATESNNLSILGVAERAATGHVITQATEHKAVLDPVGILSARGFSVTVLPVDREGKVAPEDLRRAIRPDTRLVSVMLANNEVGTVQPIAELAAIAHEGGALFHCDATQGVGRVGFDVEAMGIDFASLSAHKIYGPKGVGALYVRRDARAKLSPLFFGGGQERGVRPGTLNVPGIVGFGAAAKLMTDEGQAEALATTALRDELQRLLFAAVSEISVNGPDQGRLPGNLNVGFARVEAEALLSRLGRRLAVSAGAACTSATQEPSHVLRAIGLTDDEAYASVRFGIGRGTTPAEIATVVEWVAAEVQRQRMLNA